MPPNLKKKKIKKNTDNNNKTNNFKKKKKYRKLTNVCTQREKIFPNLYEYGRKI